MGYVCITGAFAEIDWHDYAIVQTIEFTAADATSELPPPMSLQEVENMTLAQKRMAAMVMETTVEDVEALRAKQAQEAAEAAIQAQQEDEAAMEESDDEDKEENERRRREEEERQRELTAVISDLRWWPPEDFTQKDSEPRRPSKEGDIWSLGMTVFVSLILLIATSFD